jgi:uncharacterized protein
VLLGDPQQLEQPQQASHPPGAGASALEHLLGGTKTIAHDRGVFLGQTRRLHPDICKFTAEAFYEGRLKSVPGLERQAVLAPTGSAADALGSAGLVYVPVEHDANQSRAKEEVDAIAALVEALTADGVRYRDAAGEEAPFRLQPARPAYAPVGRRQLSSLLRIRRQFRRADEPQHLSLRRDHR